MNDFDECDDTQITKLESENARLTAENVALRLEQKMRLMAEESNARLREELAAKDSTIASCDELLALSRTERDSLREQLAAARERIKDLVAGDVMHEPDWRSSNEV